MSEHYFGERCDGKVVVGMPYRSHGAHARMERSMRTVVFVSLATLAGVATTPSRADQTQTGGAPECRPGGPTVDLSGSATSAQAHTYTELPVAVAPGTTRLEVGYAWTSNGPETDFDQTVVDLGLWDQRGTSGPAGFRGWSGSREGNTAKGQPPIFVQADAAERGYVPGPIEPGTWAVELGFGAVHSAGASWQVSVRCLSPRTDPAWQPDPVDPSFVANPSAGWYRADLHLHGYESNARGPDPATMIEYARKAKLDVVPVTEYVTDVHWGTLGATQRANPDIVVWPGREVITYSGHAIVLGETPSTLEYRQGYDGVDLGDIERASVADGAVFQVAHPTVYPGALRPLCRGCEFELGDHIDWDLVDTIEVVSSPPLIDPTTLDPPAPGASGIENPFTATAVDLWESLLQQGHRITGVAGSDDKLGPQYGITATMIHADQLSRAALVAALRAGHAYVQVRGADHSPTFDVDAHTPDGAHAGFGDTLNAKTAAIDVTAHGATGQTLIVSRDGTEMSRVPVTADPFSTTITADRDPGEGPLGTFWRVDVADGIGLTAIGNPVFLADRQPPAKQRPAPPTVAPTIPNFPTVAGTASPAPSGSSRTAWWLLVAVGVVVSLVVVAVAVLHRRRGHVDEPTT